MKEVTFINRNKKRWEQFEQLLAQPKTANPDILADQFLQLTDDLAFARTFYPRSSTTRYLNTLSQKTHQEVYRNKREKGSRMLSFFIQEVPLVLYKARPYFILALVLFLVAAGLGAASAITDDTFVRYILGDDYVNMTLDNIEKGDPMAVYGKMAEMPMFFAITFNNIAVSFYVFVYGIFTPLGSIYILFKNGIMVGAFQAFFYQKHLMGVSTMAIMIHGTLELWAIVLAGGAGIIFGKSILFPGTFSRKESFIQGAREGVKIVVALVPVFVTAGFLESFVTRHYQTLDTPLNFAIIIVSLAFIIWYFFIYPIQVYKKTLSSNGTN